MSSIIKNVRKNPFLGLILGATGGGLGLAFFMLGRQLYNDPTVVLANRAKDPYPWIHVEVSNSGPAEQEPQALCSQ
jgi:NADH-ubiquinone reductase complex 1 MLRQ subunit